MLPAFQANGRTLFPLPAGEGKGEGNATHENIRGTELNQKQNP